MTDIIPTIFLLASLLGLVSFLPPLAHRLGVPLAVLLAAVGVGLGLLATFGSHFRGMGPIAEVVGTLGEFEITSAVFLYVFLPVLLFEASLGMDVRRLMDDLGPVLLLAIVAVVVSTLVVGLALAWTSQYGLIACLLLAAVISTTDPSAVVAIFRDLGAPSRLLVLVEGEALFNDAAAIALFTFLVPILAYHQELDLGEGVRFFARAFIGGMATGWVLAMGLVTAVAYLKRHGPAEITLSVAVGYLSYIVAEHYFHFSGVVAVVTAALTFGTLGRTRIAPENWEAMHKAWQQLGFWSSSLIFVFASMLIPRTLEGATWTHAWLLAVMIVAALVARALVLFGLLPVMRVMNLAQRIDNAYKTVIVWGGLRGAITLVLALAATENRMLPSETRQFIGVLATGFVLFTLFVNALTLKPLIRLLGLDRISAADLAMRDRVLALSLASVQENVERVAREYRIDDAPAREVAGFYARRREQVEHHDELKLSDDDRIYIGLMTLSNREMELCLARFNARIIGRAITATMTTHASRLRDAVKTGGVVRDDGSRLPETARPKDGEGAILAYRTMADRANRFGLTFRLALTLQRRLGVTGPLATQLARRFEVFLISQSVVRDLIAFNQKKLGPLLGEAVQDRLDTVLGQRLDGIQDRLAALKLQYPDYANRLQSSYLARAALGRERQEYAMLREESVIGSEIHQDLERDVDRRAVQLEQPPRLDLGLSREALLARVPMFASLDGARLTAIARIMRPALALPGERIITKGERGDSMFFVSSGAVEVEVEPQPVRLGSGAFFGEIALLFGQPRNANVRALGYCQLLILESRDFDRLRNADPAIGQHITEVARTRVHPQPA
ncbi:cation:proton antiporter [Zavarzinia sp. CC-PAN008]|uniref:cation:proton antiporter n=1 Tax=Zavarzinia sp. CC-PAN008 TaxID=3243332 RepID=UPI003F74398A